MPEAKLLEEKRVFPKQVGILFRVCEWSDWVGLGMIVVRLRNNRFGGRMVDTYSVSN